MSNIFLQGTLTDCTEQGDEFRGNRYSFAKLTTNEGDEYDLMFVNRDVAEFENSYVSLEDISDEGNKIRWEDEKERYRVYGTRVSFVVDGEEVSDSPPPAKRSARPSRPSRSSGPSRPAGRGGGGGRGPAARPARSRPAARGRDKDDEPPANMAVLIRYALACVNYARELGEEEPEVLASVFGTAVHGFKEGRAGIPCQDLEDKAKEYFDAQPKPKPKVTEGPDGPEEEEDDIPF